MIDLPHFSIPFRFVNGAAVVFEQDTTDEIMACDLAILLCPLGFRVELPTFGIPDLTFSQGLPNTDVLEAALAEWEPRSQQLIASEPDALDALIAHVSVRVGTPSED
jgi:hypothetical protein